MWDLPDPRQPNSLLSQRSLAPPRSLLPVLCLPTQRLQQGGSYVGVGAGGSPPGSMLLGLMCPHRLRREQKYSLQKPLSRYPLPVCTIGLSGLHHVPRQHLLPTTNPSWFSHQALRDPAALPAALPEAMLSSSRPLAIPTLSMRWKAQLWPPKMFWP